ncbi:MAG: helix-turn-helix transcriptional regulator [Clostridiales bacterium]|nr:helix-turn-helix transcriptional regulator [Clostridiales bacterium]
MKVKRFFSTKRVFFRFLLQFIAFLLLPVIFASSLYLSSVQQAEQSCIDASLISLRHVRNEFDSYVRALDQVATQIMFEPQLNKMATISRPDYGSLEVYSIQQFGESLKSKMSSSPHIDTSFILLMENVSAAYYKDYVVFDLEFFYNNFLKYSDYSFDEWNNIIFQYKNPFFLPEGQIIKEGVSTNALTYVFPLRAGYTGRKTVLFFISKEKLEEFCTGTESNLNRNIYILDSEGKLLFNNISCDFEYNNLNLSLQIDDKQIEGFYFDTIESEKYMVVYARSQLKDVIFTEVIPQSLAMEKVIDIKQTTLYMVIAYLIIGILSAISFAQRNSRPINELINKLIPFSHKLDNTPHKKNVNEYEYITTGVDYLKNTVEESYNELKDIFLDRIFNGNFNNQDEIKQAGEKLNINIDSSHYCAAIIKFVYPDDKKDIYELDIQENDIENICNEFIQELPEFIFGARIRKQQISLLFVFQDNNTEAIEDIMYFLLKTRNDIQEHEGVDIISGVGRMVSTLTDVQYSFEQALFVLKNVEKGQYGVYRYDELPDTSIENIFYYPIEMEHKLINYTKAGDFKNVQSLLDTIYEENITKRKLTRRVGALLMGNLQSTLLKICADSYIEPEYSKKIRQLNVNMPQAVVLERITNIFLEICELYSLKKSNQKDSLINDIIKFVQDHFDDPMMGVPMVAEKFNFSESYFSQFFKEYTNQNFSTYLEKYRINKAKELICENKYDLENISCMVGYNNSNTFRRAFKRVEGITPSAYKENARNK